MQFFKKNYEKILLGLALAGLVAVVVYLLFVVTSEKQSISDLRNTIINAHVDPLPAPDLSRADQALQRAGTAMVVDFSSTNKLFNPVTWGRTVDGRMVKIDERKTLNQLVIVKPNTPLYLVLSLDNVSVAPDRPPRFGIGIEHQGALLPSRRPKKPFFGSVGDKSDLFVIRAFQGPADEPTNVSLDLLDSGERVSVSKDIPFKRVEGYSTDLAYPPEKKTFPARRVGQMISFAGEDYNIVAISTNEVLLSAKSNQKKWSKVYNSPP